MLRGEIWFGVWPNDPSKKQRPLLIVSNNHRNSLNNMHDIVVVKLTSLERSDGSKKKVNIAEDVLVKLKKSTIIRCGAIYAVEKSFLKIKATELTPNQMSEVDEKLKIVLDLNY